MPLQHVFLYGHRRSLCGLIVCWLCALQDGFSQTWWTGDMSIPLQFASLYDGQEVFMWSDCLLDLCPDFLNGNVIWMKETKSSMEYLICIINAGCPGSSHVFFNFLFNVTSCQVLFCSICVFDTIDHNAFSFKKMDVGSLIFIVTASKFISPH